MKLALISPCFNEEEIIEASVERLIKLLEELIAEEVISEDSFILLVNDGS